MLLVICGYSASGKDTYQNWLLDRNPSMRRAVSYTTRPIRPNEKEGIEYYFTDNNSYMELENSGKILSHRSYNTYENGKVAVWHYGLPKSEVKDNTIFTTILDHEGARRVLNKLGKERVKIVYLEAEEDELYERSKMRQDEHREFVRRMEDDKIKFKGVGNVADLMLRTDTDRHGRNLYKIEKLLGVNKRCLEID